MLNSFIRMTVEEAMIQVGVDFGIVKTVMPKSMALQRGLLEVAVMKKNGDLHHFTSRFRTKVNFPTKTPGKFGCVPVEVGLKSYFVKVTQCIEIIQSHEDLFGYIPFDTFVDLNHAVLMWRLVLRHCCSLKESSAEIPVDTKCFLLNLCSVVY